MPSVHRGSAQSSSHSRGLLRGEYLPFFRDAGASDIVRSNHSEYSANIFEREGIQHHHMEFPQFLALADVSNGVISVYCLAGLGRTGTLIAVWLMGARGCSAIEAMTSWLRIVRPGSIIGVQQHFLAILDGWYTASSDSAISESNTSGWHELVRSDEAGLDLAEVRAVQVRAGLEGRAMRQGTERVSTAQGLGTRHYIKKYAIWFPSLHHQKVLNLVNRSGPTEHSWHSGG
jgi:protein-tyrosine phosphatase